MFKLEGIPLSSMNSEVQKKFRNGDISISLKVMNCSYTVFNSISMLITVSSEVKLCFSFVSKSLIDVPPEEQKEFPVLGSCKQSCKCTSCGNRFVEEGANYPVGVYYVSESMGFDLRSKAFIPKGAFVGLYAGQLLDEKAAAQVKLLFAKHCSLLQLSFIVF